MKVCYSRIQKGNQFEFSYLNYIIIFIKICIRSNIFLLYVLYDLYKFIRYIVELPYVCYIIYYVYINEILIYVQKAFMNCNSICIHLYNFKFMTLIKK
ncbi:hypothetical protein PFAG_03478 [Plasmodium falciparum Santa Lucia]|uniref:Uncharacterized protein n=3 Tax=Plasmodium falciparum TaxID=5833 RepID=A0A024W5U3_PLAFA|nr:hypothetical protein PFTANZ_03491 [Plasmodium falciparum Tanzania (2000708)]EUR70321.1 hypothetical protein PFBG_03548 [Plasmodium falciparum 7G8]EUT83603.1 hypothetical protein PFAG_03478 [Plasmodium falciparum Santa Lucia]